MDHEDGFCDTCGADVRAAVSWLRLDGTALCTSCAIENLAGAVRLPAKPEARDDGR